MTTSSTTDPKVLWGGYSRQLARTLELAEELAGLGPRTLRASAPTGRRRLMFLCGEAPRDLRADQVQLLAEETLVDSIDTLVCLTAVGSVGRDRVLQVLPGLVGQLLSAAMSGDENKDTDCSVGLDLLWLYGAGNLLDIVLPTLLSLDDWLMTRSAESFVDQHGDYMPSPVSDSDRNAFAESVDARPFYSYSGTELDRTLTEEHRPRWDEWWAAYTTADQLTKQIAKSGPDAVLTHALSGATEDERYLVARFISSHYSTGSGRGLARVAELTGEDFEPVWLPELLAVADRRCHGAARLYRDLRRLFVSTGRLDLVEEVVSAEWRNYGRHDDKDRLVQARR